MDEDRLYGAFDRIVTALDGLRRDLPPQVEAIRAELRQVDQHRGRQARRWIVIGLVLWLVVTTVPPLLISVHVIRVTREERAHERTQLSETLIRHWDGSLGELAAELECVVHRARAGLPAIGGPRPPQPGAVRCLDVTPPEILRP